MKPTHPAKVAAVSLLLLACSVGGVLAIGIDDTNKYAWGENVGWLNWGTSEGAVDVPTSAGDLTGYVWGENIGWISLNCSNTSSCGTVDYGVERSGGELSGYAWGENVGWISFSCTNTASCGVVDYGVSVDDTTGVFSGYAWGENIGWISLNCSNTSSCGTVDYGVSTVAVPGDGDDGGDGGGGFLPPSPPAPVITVSKIPSASAVRAGDPITYQVTIRNVGNSTATGVMVSDAIDPNTTLVWVMPSPATNNGSTFTYALGTLEPGESFSYTSNVRVNAGTPPGTPIQNTVRVTGGNFTQVTAVSSAIVVAGEATESPSPGPTASPLPSPFPTPTTSPGPIMPPGPPMSPAPTPSGPFERFVGPIIGAISEFLNALAEAMFGLFGETCEGTLGIAACGITALTVVVVGLAVFAVVVQTGLAAGLFSLLQLFGLTKRVPVWGVVYDSVTKRPIATAKVELIDSTGRVLEVRYASREGRYGFLTTPTSLQQQELRVSIRVSKSGYRFPSALRVSGTDYVVYENPYVGGEFIMPTGEVMNRSIPLDPVAHGGGRADVAMTGVFGEIGHRFLALGFIVGLIVVPLNYYLRPTRSNLVILVFFFLASILRIVFTYRPHGITTDALTGKKLPYTLVVLMDEHGRRITFAVSDERGRYMLPAQSNRHYDLVVYTPASVVPQRMSRRRISNFTHVGRTAWVTDTLRI